MIRGRTSASEPSPGRINRRVVRGSVVVLLTVGGVVWVVGSAVGVASVLAEWRAYLAQMDPSPRQIAERRLVRLRVAANAGAQAWQAGDDESVAASGANSVSA